MTNLSSTIVVAGKSSADIQSAINKLPAEGGEVIVKAGKYICSNYILINRDHVTLRGEGNATVLRLADNANSPVIIMGQDAAVPTAAVKNIHISNLVIDGNRANQRSEYWRGKSALRNNGISIRRCEDCSVEAVTVYSTASGGLVAELKCRRLTVRDFTSFDNEFDGLAAYQTEDSWFTGLKLHNNHGAGLSFDIKFNNNTISNAVLADNAKVGVFIRDSNDNVFQDLQIHNSGEHGIFLAQVDADNTKSANGNSFIGVSVSGSNGAGIRVNDSSCANNSVVNSHFTGNTRGCIEGVIAQSENICQ